VVRGPREEKNGCAGDPYREKGEQTRKWDKTHLLKMGKKVRGPLSKRGLWQRKLAKRKSEKKLENIRREGKGSGGLLQEEKTGNSGTSTNSTPIIIIMDLEIRGGQSLSVEWKSPNLAVWPAKSANNN